MNTEKINVSIINNHTQVVNNEIIALTGHYPNCSLLLTFSTSNNIEVKGHDFFKCLTNLRIELEKHKCNILCNGARKDVCCGGMLRRYSNGLKGHVMNLGKYLSEDDEIFIFDYANANLVVSIDEQKKFYKKYCNSLPDYPNE